MRHWNFLSDYEWRFIKKKKKNWSPSPESHWMFTSELVSLSVKKISTPAWRGEWIDPTAGDENLEKPREERVLEAKAHKGQVEDAGSVLERANGKNSVLGRWWNNSCARGVLHFSWPQAEPRRVEKRRKARHSARVSGLPAQRASLLSTRASATLPRPFTLPSSRGLPLTCRRKSQRRRGETPERRISCPAIYRPPREKPLHARALLPRR